MAEKKVSSCVIIYDPTKKTMIAAHPTGRPWKNKDGSPKTGVFTLLKGELDSGEDMYHAAIREIEEESGLKLEKSKLKYLGHYKYIEYKDLEMFYYEMEDVDLKKLKCSSKFEGQDGKFYPELNGFINLVYPEEKKYLFFCLQKVLDKIEQDHPDLFS